MANRARGSASRGEGYRSVNPTRMPRSAFDLSYSNKLTAEPSILIPFWHEEVMPGDTISWKPSFLVRQSSSVFPVLDGIRLEYHAAWIPMRQLWDNWTKMHGERINPTDHTDYTVPQVMIGVTNSGTGGLFDYLGCPTGVIDYSVSALYARAYTAIWNHWFRDQNFTPEVPVPTDDGPDQWNEEHLQLRPRMKVKDRFAGALPFAQKGDPVTLPLGTSAPVTYRSATDNIPTFTTDGVTGPAESATAAGGTWTINPSWTGKIGWADTALEADLENATAATIESIRVAVSLQQMFERDARGGTRYHEQIYSHFGVRMDFVRYQSEILAAGTVNIMSMEVPQTTPPEEGAANPTPQGNISAYVKGVGTGRGFTKSFDEWGICMAFLTIRSEVSYSQGVPAAFLRQTRVDHYTPDLSLLGEEPIKNGEIFMSGGWAVPGGDPETDIDLQNWGYSPRYESYRHRVNQISGAFRSNATDGPFGSLDRWHYGLDFATRPNLNEEFITDDPNPIKRNTEYDEVQPFWIDTHNRVTAVRPMPKVATPGLLRL